MLSRYEVAKKKGDYDEESQIRENAKQALERYMHYYQRFAENDKARLQVWPPPAQAAQKHFVRIVTSDLESGHVIKMSGLLAT